MEKVEKFLNKYWVVFLFVLIVPTIWALFLPGYYGASDDIHIAWLYEFHKTLFSGQIPPRFVPDLSFGFGYPLFNFVFPLPFYFAEVIHLLGFGLVDSIKFLFFLTVPISAFFMYLFLKEFSSKAFAIAGALLYVYAPYRSVDLYIRGAIGEVLSFVFLPLIALSTVKLTSSGGVKWIGIGSLSLAGLVLTHNITSYMFLPFIILLSFLRIVSYKDKLKKIKNLLITAVLALLISSYFWLPALLDSSLMKYDTVFNFADHFPTLLQLVKPYFGYGASVPGPYDGMSFFLGSMNLVVFIVGLLLLVLNWSKLSQDKKVISAWAIICFFSAVFLMNFRSSFIWSNFPFLPYFQFPWRFLILTSFSMPILITTLDKINFKLLPQFIILLTLLTSASYFRPEDFLGRGDDYYLNRYIPTPVASEEYKLTQEEYLRLPVGTMKRPDQNYPLFFGEGIIKDQAVSDFHSKAEVSSENGFNLNYSKYLFPGWVVKIDGGEDSPQAGEPFGQIQVFVPKGSHQVEVFFKETNFKLILDAISLAAFLVSLWLANKWNLSRKTGLSS